MDEKLIPLPEGTVKDAAEFMSDEFTLDPNLMKQIKDIRENSYLTKDIEKLPEWLKDLMPTYYIATYGFRKAWEIWLSFVEEEGIFAFKKHRHRSGQWVPDTQRMQLRSKIASMSPIELLEHSVAKYKEELDTNEETKNLPQQKKDERVEAFRNREEREMGVVSAWREQMYGPDRPRMLEEMRKAKDREVQRRRYNAVLDELRSERAYWVDTPKEQMAEIEDAQQALREMIESLKYLQETLLPRKLEEIDGKIAKIEKERDSE